MRNHFSTNHERAQVYRGDGRMIGGIVGDTLCKHIIGSKHILRTPHGIAFDESILHPAENAGALNVLVIDDETGIEYRAPIQRYFTRGIRINRGCGTQRVLLLSDFNVDKEAPTPTIKPTQPSLFNLSALLR